MTNSNSSTQPILVLGANGKTGRRVVERLQTRGLEVRIGSRNAMLPFDWQDASTWPAVLDGVQAVYISYYPDLAVPEAPAAIEHFCRLAVEHQVQHIVLLSGRGEDEAQRCEDIVKRCGVNWTILRSSWFFQNFSESFFRDFVVAGQLALPVGDVQEPFIDADDIADVAVAALTEPKLQNRLYELTGPRLMSFADVSREIAKATGSSIEYVPISQQDFNDQLKAQQVPENFIGLLEYLFTTVMDGRNQCLTEGVSQALARAPRDFSDYAQHAAESGAWIQNK